MRSHWLLSHNALLFHVHSELFLSLCLPAVKAYVLSSAMPCLPGEPVGTCRGVVEALRGGRMWVGWQMFVPLCKRPWSYPPNMHPSLQGHFPPTAPCCAVPPVTSKTSRRNTESLRCWGSRREPLYLEAACNKSIIISSSSSCCKPSWCSFCARLVAGGIS